MKNLIRRFKCWLGHHEWIAGEHYYKVKCKHCDSWDWT